MMSKCKCVGGVLQTLAVVRLLIKLLKKEYISAAICAPIERSKAVKVAKEGELCLTQAHRPLLLSTSNLCIPLHQRSIAGLV